MRTRNRVLLVALTLVVGATRPSPAAPAGEGLIVPGQSLAGLRLGTAVGTIYQLPGWGRPDRVHASGSISYMSYTRQRVTVAVRESAVVLILTTNERFRTDRGIAVGQAVSAANTAYGAAAAGGDGRTFWHDAIGLVVITGGGTILRIGVYDPKVFVRAILAEERPARDVFITAQPPAYATQADAEGPKRTAAVVVTLRNTSPGGKVLNPNFFTLVDQEGQKHRYDRSTFSRPDACRSTVTVPPGERKSCSIVFVLPAGRNARSIVYDDGGSLDEFTF